MFEWLKRFLSPPKPIVRTSLSDDANKEAAPSTENASKRPEWKATVSRLPNKPRTLSAELENKHLDRPILFEPALAQYSAFRAGEPVFSSESEGARWFALRSHVLRHILSHICQSPASEHVVLRGSLLMSLWFGDDARRPGDIDWVVIPDTWRFNSSEAKKLIRTIQDCLRGTRGDGEVEFTIPDQKFVSEDIWTYEKAPGKRLIVPWHCQDATMNGTVQIDLVFEEIIPGEPTLIDIGPKTASAIQIAGATIEQSLAWKLLWLETDTYGQGKDLFDAVLLAEHCVLDAQLLRDTFRVGDVTGIANNDALGRFNAETIRRWYIEWDDFKTEYPNIRGTEEAWKERLISALAPLFAELEE